MSDLLDKYKSSVRWIVSEDLLMHEVCPKFATNKSTVARSVGYVNLALQEQIMPSVCLRSGEALFPESSLKHL